MFMENEESSMRVPSHFIPALHTIQNSLFNDLCYSQTSILAIQNSRCMLRVVKLLHVVHNIGFKVHPLPCSTHYNKEVPSHG
ncbi:hypothetical protein CUMW_198590 [Citrus unshiu]|nr:hypothetical protein CUMW_198590 [Citrus unshiu]